MDFFTKIKEILVKPSKFFTEVEKEKGIKNSFIYISILIIFFSLASLILLLIFKEKMMNLFFNVFNLAAELPAFDLNKLIIILLLSIPVSILLTFVTSAILYVWLLIFRGEKDYQTTYKLYTYSRTPTFLFGWIPIINWFSWIYSLILLIIGTHKIYKFTKLKSTLIYLIPLFILIIVFIAFMFLLLLILATSQSQSTQTF